ncbi:hypothetical protein LOAG_01782 [Loa loa]|uniref:Uncharacterized protein n=1 Tax=Loa loa TaxID=7209 RepID=A0A1S0UA35_LOALO|nr:hypothetical protein LOAG_01782 [Loa loa]EFO26706.1 hypothetical protein LOAG_01782 [Loa loa]
MLNANYCYLRLQRCSGILNLKSRDDEKSSMRLFFVVKAMQMINCFVIIALLLGTFHLCGKTSLDRKLFLKNALSPNERNFNRRHRNKVVVSNKYSENETTEASNNSRNNSAATDYDEMTAFSEIFESRSCLTIDTMDPSCFVWRNSGNKSPCQAISGITFPIAVVSLDLMHLIYTIISVSRRILPPSKETDFVRCAIHILLWCTASTSTVYLLYTWEYAWRYTEFKAKIPKQFYMAMLPVFLDQISA